MLATCKYCNRIHDKNKQCSAKKEIIAKQREKRDTAANKLRRTNRWKEKSKDIRKRDNNLCQVCLLGIDGPKVINNINIQVHHIEPLEQSIELAYEDSNLISLCKFHHDRAEEEIISKEILNEIVKDIEAKHEEYTPLA